MSGVLSKYQETALRSLRQFEPTAEMIEIVSRQIRNSQIAGITVSGQEAFVLYSRAVVTAQNMYRLYGKRLNPVSRQDISRIAQHLTENHFSRV